MNTLAKKKLNLLLHLAKVDGKYDKSEKALLHLFAKKEGVMNVESKEPIKFNEFGNTESKIELLYWALQLVQIDKVIHEKEIQFCKDVALKLGFKEDIVKYFVYGRLPEFNFFEKEVKKSWTIGTPES